MKKRNNIIVIAIIALLLAVGTVAAINLGSNSMNMSVSQSSSNNQSAVATNKVTITNYSFSPAVIKVSVGTTVTWMNQDDVHHTVTMDSGSNEGPNSSPLSKGQSTSFTYTKAGTYTYHCAIHPEMTGKVIVI